jgi:hypothetical protein
MRLAYAAFAAGLGCSAAALLPTHILAGAWTLPEDQGQAIATTTFTRSTRVFDENGNAVPTPTFDKLESSLFFEYGIRDWLTLILETEFLSYDIAPPIDAHTSGPGYTDVGGRVRLWSNTDSVFSAQAVARLPGRHDETNPAEVGNTDPELDLRVLYGHSFSLRGLDSYIDAQLGYRVRFDDPPNEVRFDFTFGVRPLERLMLLAQSFNTISDGSAQGIFDDSHEHKIELSAVWSLDDAWSVQLGAIATVAGEDALRERGVVAALWRRF